MGTTAQRWRVRLALALAVWLAAAGSAAAGSFSLAPIRVEMDKGHATGVLTLHNDADTPVTIQIEAAAWSQPEDADRYAPTRDLIVTPPVFVVQPKSDQIVRVARRPLADTGSEVPYRLFFQEVPDSTPQSGTGLKIALRVGIPVFVAAAGAAPDLAFSAETTAEGAVAITATNRGRAHVQITDFEVKGDNGTVVGGVSGSRYLLPGTAARWTLKPATGEAPNGTLKIQGHSDRGAIAVDVALPAR
jgi:fimbrial chaperone protein